MMSSSNHHNPSYTSALRFAAVSLLLFAVTALAFASKGGGEKKKHHELDNSFTPIRTASSFTLRNTTLYTGSIVSFHSQADNRISMSAMVTYQRGNTTLILPYQYKVNTGPCANNYNTRSNLQFLGVRIQIPK